MCNVTNKNGQCIFTACLLGIFVAFSSIFFNLKILKYRKNCLIFTKLNLANLKITPLQNSKRKDYLTFETWNQTIAIFSKILHLFLFENNSRSTHLDYNLFNSLFSPYHPPKSHSVWQDVYTKVSRPVSGKKKDTSGHWKDAVRRQRVRSSNEESR